MKHLTPRRCISPSQCCGILGYALIAVLALANKLWLTLQAAEIGFAFAAFLSYLEATSCRSGASTVSTRRHHRGIVLVTGIALYLEYRRKKRFANSAVVAATVGLYQPGCPMSSHLGDLGEAPQIHRRTITQVA